jgi:hypothetical protein
VIADSENVNFVKFSCKIPLLTIGRYLIADKNAAGECGAFLRR